MIPSWLVIGAVTLLLAFLSNSLVNSRGARWFRRLRRPNWLTFEKAIPIIWTVIFICGAGSAVIVWEQDPGSPMTWVLMGLYFILELITVSYTPLMLWLRRLQIGVLIGGIGAILGVLLAILVWSVSPWATLLLIPYVIWSPIGTYTTWEMSRLNPRDA